MKTKKNNMSQIRIVNVFFVIGLMLIPLLIMRWFDAQIVFFNNDDVFLAELDKLIFLNGEFLNLR